MFFSVLRTKAYMPSTVPTYALHQRKKAPLPLLPKPPFFHALQTGTHPNERRHPYPFYRSPRLFTPCTLEYTRTPLPFPFTFPFVIPFAIFLNYSFCHFPLPYPFTIYLCHIPLPFLFTIIFFYNDFHLECEKPWFMGFLQMKIDISLIFSETIICRKKCVFR